MKNLILGIIDKYTFDQISNFVKSLQLVNFEGHVCLFAGPNIGVGTLSKIKKFDIEVISYAKEFPYVSDPHIDNFKRIPHPIHIYNFRHFLYYDYLLKNKQKFAYTLITDVQDVVFQKDPFDFHLEEFIYVAIENTLLPLGSCSWNSKWIRSGYDEDIFDYLKEKEMICAGTTLAPTRLMLHYLKKIIEEFFIVKDTLRCADQAMHNKLIHYNEIKPISKSYNFDGPILTVGTEATYLLDEKKNLVSIRGEIIPIVHQYNRHKELNKIFNKKNKNSVLISTLCEGKRKYLKKYKKLLRKLSLINVQLLEGFMHIPF